MFSKDQKYLSPLEYSIVSTIVFFDIFNYPLTLFEIWKWLYRNFQFSIFNYQLSISNFQSKYKISDIQETLENSGNLKKIIATKNGFYFLKGREDLVNHRQKQHKIAQPRWKKLKRIITLLQIVPYIKMIAACNTMAIYDIKPQSDIDVFIIVKSGRMWLTRFLTTLLVGALRQWRHKKRIANKICLSFYITDDNLNLKSIAKKPYDIYLLYWITLVYPLLDREMYKKFILSNSWIKSYIPNYIDVELSLTQRMVLKNPILDSLRKFFENILNTQLGNLFEDFLRKIQKEKMAKNVESAYQKNDGSVIISDKMLKFHEIDRRDEFRNRFETKLKKLFVDNL